MNFPIRHIQIKNFKSLKDVCLDDCNRINLFIGKPNVGKSNILEALSLFSLPFMKYLKKRDLRQFIRVENVSELFNNGDTKEDITVEADVYHASVSVSDKYTLGVELDFPDSQKIELPFPGTLVLPPKKIFRM